MGDWVCWDVCLIVCGSVFLCCLLVSLFSRSFTFIPFIQIEQIQRDVQLIVNVNIVMTRDWQPSVMVDGIETQLWRLHEQRPCCKSL